MKKKNFEKNPDGFILPARGRRKYKVHVIAGTHWDREWRFTAEQSKLRLMELIDEILDIMEKDSEFGHFVLDGGSVILEDYMDVRPENRQRLDKLMRQGRISVGSLYTLPDNNLIAPEALVRNLLIGRRVSREFGGPMREGYTATSYGQPAQLPQIYRDFGIKSILFYRGTHKHQVPPACYWQGRDGSELLLIRCFDEWNRSNWDYFAYLPIVSGKPYTPELPLELTSYDYEPEKLPVHMADEELYEMSFKALNDELSVPRSKKAIKDGFQTFRDQAYKYAIGRHVLGLYMEDCASPWPNHPKLIKALNEQYTDTEIVQSDVDDYVADIVKEVKGIDLHVAKGEMRYTAIEYGMNGLFGMTPSSRVKMKLLNERAETGLILTAEPLASIAEAFGAEYPRTILDKVWLALLKNHSHDSICGAANDDVHEDMIYRFRQVRTVADEVGKRSVEAIWRRIGFTRYDKDDQSLTIFNTLPFKRSGIHMFVLDLPSEIFKGPGFRRHAGGTQHNLFDILDKNGKKVDYERIDVQTTSIHCESKVASSAASIAVTRHRILMSVDLPPMGYQSFLIRKRAPRYIFAPKPGKPRGHIGQPGGILENELIKVEINSNGSFNLTDKKNSRTFRNLNSFEDRVSTGHSHVDSNIMCDSIVSSLGLPAVITMEESNSHRGIYRIDLRMPVPKEAIGPWYRSKDMIEIPITVWLTLRKGSKRVDIRTKVDNRAKDHRMLVMFPTEMKTNTISVDAPFTVEERDFRWKDTADNTESHYAYQPMQNFIDIADKKSGLAILNKGMREYAVWDDPAKTVSITLFRTYRVYVTANGNMTPEELEKYPGSNSLGTLEYHYAVCPHAGNWRQGGVMTEALDFKTPARAIQGPAKKGDLPATQSFFKIEPEGKIMLSALCQSEDGQATILRVWNTTDEPVEAKIKTTLDFKSAHKVHMSEDEDGKKLQIRNRIIKVPMRKAEIVTIRLDR